MSEVRIYKLDLTTASTFLGENTAMRLVVGNGGSGKFTGGNAVNSLTVVTTYLVETTA